MVLKISYNPFFLEGLKDKYQTMKMIFFFWFIGGIVGMHRAEQCLLSFVFQRKSLHS